MELNREALHGVLLRDAELDEKLKDTLISDLKSSRVKS